MINGYKPGANISLLNVIYHRPKKLPTGKYSKDSIDIIYKDMNTGKKKLQHIIKPTYTYYIAKDGVNIPCNQLYIKSDLVEPVTCKYTELKKDIATRTSNIDFFYDNIRNGNYRNNDELFSIKRVFNADMNIEDYYRKEFDRLYKNDPIDIHLAYFDIEADTIHMRGDFPEPGECPVNAITLINEETNTVYTFLLENYKNPLIDKFKKTSGIIDKLKVFIRKAVGGWKNEIRYGLDKMNYKIVFYDEEIKLIHDFFNLVNILKPDFALAWNMAFDIPYLIERIKVLGYEPTEIICDKDFKDKEAYYFVDRAADKFEERTDYAQISSYTVYIDQLITFASRRKGQRNVFSSFKLDDIGEAVAKVRKLNYSNITTNIAKLPYKNYYVFVFYNIMDTIVQYCVEKKTGDISYVYNKAMINNTRFSKVHRQTTYLVNRATKEFLQNGNAIIGCNVNKKNQKVGFPGAFVADPTLVSDKPKLKVNGKPVMLFDNLNDYDYKRLYPSLYFQHNMAPNTMIAKIIIDKQIDPNENKFNNDYFNRSVSFIEDYVCRNYLDFGHRYLNLGDYEQVFDDIIEYYTLKARCGFLRTYDPLTGMRFMMQDVSSVSSMPKQMIEEFAGHKPMFDNQYIMPKGGKDNK